MVLEVLNTVGSTVAENILNETTFLSANSKTSQSNLRKTLSYKVTVVSREYVEENATFMNKRKKAWLRKYTSHARMASAVIKG